MSFIFSYGHGGLAWARPNSEARSFFLFSHVGGKAHMLGPPFPAFPKAISRYLDWKWNSWELKYAFAEKLSSTVQCQLQDMHSFCKVLKTDSSWKVMSLVWNLYPQKNPHNLQNNCLKGGPFLPLSLYIQC